MAGKNEMSIEILPDGQLRIETGDMQGVNHRSADEFLKELQRLMGGDVSTKKAPHAHGHNHSHERLKQ
jgi:hypothetical protein